jgi:hypothetical protein
MQMFIYSLLGIKFSVILICLPWLLLLPTLLFSKEKIKFELKSWSPLDYLISALIGLKVVYVFFEALIKPVYGWDALWNFSLRAKIFFFEKMVPLAKASPYFLGGGMKQYPLQIPLIETWSFLVMNSWDDVKIKIIFPLYFCALLIIFYAALRNEKNRTHSLFFTFLLSSLPLLTYHATIEYADFVVGVYFFSASVYLYRYFQENENRYLILSALLAGFAGWVKDEGIMFYLICIFALWLYSGIKNWKKVAAYCLPLLFLTIPWLFIKQLLGLSLGNEPNFAFSNLSSYLSFHPEVIGKIMEKTFLAGNWHLLPLALIVFLIFYYKKIFFSNKKYLFLCLGLGWGFFMYLYLFTYNSSMIIPDIILSRNYLTYLPLAMLLIGLGFDFDFNFLNPKPQKTKPREIKKSKKHRHKKTS